MTCLEKTKFGTIQWTGRQRFLIKTACKKQTYQYLFFLKKKDIAKILPTSYFECFGHEWPRPSKTIMPTCRNLYI